MKVYVATALTHASDEYRSLTERLKKHLRSEQHEVLDFLGLVEGTPAEVYQHDLDQVSQAEALVVLADNPSIGIGIELGHAISLQKPILCLAHTGSVVTRMVQGAAELGLLALVFYEDEEDMFRQGSRFLGNTL